MARKYESLLNQAYRRARDLRSGIAMDNKAVALFLEQMAAAIVNLEARDHPAPPVASGMTDAERRLLLEMAHALSKGRQEYGFSFRSGEGAHFQKQIVDEPELIRDALLEVKGEKA